ncbi:Ig-like domain-containing protein [Cellulophaga baltica]|nr:hypothetical protein [Cellulophaga baltica]
MKYPFQYILLMFVTSFCSSCGGGSSSEAPLIPVPASATLIFPENNAECNEGEILSETESRVVFKWNDSEDTDSYTVNLKNLSSGEIVNYNETQNELPITIFRGTPYEWTVISKANGSNENSESDTWRFYNAGLAAESYPPFPANAIFPKMGSTITPGPIQLSWLAEDIDDDIVSFRILLDESNVPNTLIGETNSMTLNTTALTDSIYYWQVIAFDSQGNTSKSPIFEFKVD